MNAFMEKYGITPAIAERFWSRVEKNDGDDPCWIWTGARVTDGYGQIALTLEGKTKHMRTHRVSFGIVNDSEPPCVRHTCDNPPCVNPSHLLPGTVQDNMRDAAERRRFHPRNGRPHHAAVLDERSVIRIRYLHSTGRYTLTQIARIYGVSQGTVGAAVSTRTWKHLDPTGRGGGEEPIMRPADELARIRDGEFESMAANPSARYGINAMYLAALPLVERLDPRDVGSRMIVLSRRERKLIEAVRDGIEFSVEFWDEWDRIAGPKD